MSEIPKSIIDWWRKKLESEKKHLADIQAGRLEADETTVRHLTRMIPRLETTVQNMERSDAHRT